MELCTLAVRPDKLTAANVVSTALFADGAARITAINLNPTWTIPVSLIRKDIIPQMRQDPAYLAKGKIRILDGKGQEVEPSAIDWSTDSAVHYTLRQEPGAANSLGRIRRCRPYGTHR